MTLLRFHHLLIFAGIAAVPCAAGAQDAGREIHLSCIVVEEDAEGEWVVRRSLTARDGEVEAGGDSYTWRPKLPTELAPGISLKWDIGYDWPADAKAQRSVPEDRVAVTLNFWFDAAKIGQSLKNPQRTWLHLYRSGTADEKFSFTATSMTSVMLWHQFNNGNLSTKALIPLDHLLAFGTGFDALAWNIRGAPDPYGSTYVLTKGTIPVAVMRGKVGEIPRLRRLLDRKAANHRTECRPPVMSPP